MQAQTKKDLITILVLTIIFGIGTIFIGRLVDSTIAEILSIRNDIDEKTRVASSKEYQIDQLTAVDQSKVAIEENLSEIDDFIDMIEQFEIMASNTGVELTINLEEGILGEGEIEFEDNKEKSEFLQGLEVKEFEVSTTNEEGESTNVALEMMDEETTTVQGGIKINYIEINLSMKGDYEKIRGYIDLLQDSEFIINIKEIRLAKVEDGGLEAALKVRAFIFERE